jgi:hypothetical protein
MSRRRNKISCIQVVIGILLIPFLPVLFPIIVISLFMKKSDWRGETWDRSAIDWNYRHPKRKKRY